MELDIELVKKKAGILLEVDCRKLEEIFGISLDKEHSGRGPSGLHQNKKKARRGA